MNIELELERERLKEMQVLMQKVHESVLAGKSKFDLSDWAQGIIFESTPPNECGTVCCAVGFAMQHKPFNDQGLGVDYTQDYDSEQTVSIPTYLEDKNWTAVENFFGLTNLQAHYCFHDSHYPENPTPLDVSNHIQDILDEKPIRLSQEV